VTKHVIHPRPRDREKPVDIVKGEGPALVDGAGRDTDYGDAYEVRFCEGDNCEKPLPLDQPGRLVRVRGERKVVCDSCFYAFGRRFG
jgi:hypothetical protein